MKRINRCNEVVKLLSAARCCAKAIVDVAAVEFWFSAVEFVEKLLFDEADKKLASGGRVPLFKVNLKKSDLETSESTIV